jgi:hypothetical protein
LEKLSVSRWQKTPSWGRDEMEGTQQEEVAVIVGNSGPHLSLLMSFELIKTLGSILPSSSFVNPQTITCPKQSFHITASCVLASNWSQ